MEKMKEVTAIIEHHASTNILSTIIQTMNMPASSMAQDDVDEFYQNSDNVYFPVKESIIRWNLIFNTKITL